VKQPIRRLAHPAALSLGLLGSVVLFGALAAAEDAAPPARKPVTAGKHYKNIKVLKNLPADQLIPVMHTINLSLGVRCDFCHVPGAFEKDDKPMKGVARQMIVLTHNLNNREKVIENKATCYMCHHGLPVPQTQPPPPEPSPSAPAR
jgi:photosynthetic reaction center cytochrome c subunit